MRTNWIYEAKEVSLRFKETNLLEFIWLASDCVRLVSENVTIASLGVTWAWTHASCGTMADDYEPLPPGCCWPLETKTKQLMGCCLPRYSTQVCQGTKWEECGVVWQVSTPQCGGFTFANYPSSAICRSLPIKVRRSVHNFFRTQIFKFAYWGSVKETISRSSNQKTFPTSVGWILLRITGMERLSIGRTLTSRRNGVECTLIRQDAHQHYTGYPKKCPVVNFVLF